MFNAAMEKLRAHFDSIHGHLYGDQPTGEVMAQASPQKSQDRLSVAPRYPAPVEMPQSPQPVPPLPERRPGGLGSLEFSGQMPERRPEQPDDAGVMLERGWQREANALPDRAGDALEEGYRNAVDRAGLGAYQDARPNPIDDLGGQVQQRKFRY